MHVVRGHAKLGEEVGHILVLVQRANRCLSDNPVIRSRGIASDASICGHGPTDSSMQMPQSRDWFDQISGGRASWSPKPVQCSRLSMLRGLYGWPQSWRCRSPQRLRRWRCAPSSHLNTMLVPAEMLKGGARTIVESLEGRWQPQARGQQVHKLSARRIRLPTAEASCDLPIVSWGPCVGIDPPYDGCHPADLCRIPSKIARTSFRSRSRVSWGMCAENRITRRPALTIWRTRRRG